MAPAGTPQPIVDLLNTEINAVLVRPEVKAAWEKLGAVPVAMSRASSAPSCSRDRKWAKVIKDNGIKVD